MKSVKQVMYFVKDLSIKISFIWLSVSKDWQKESILHENQLWLSNELYCVENEKGQ